jgi:hypothetical protein
VADFFTNSNRFLNGQVRIKKMKKILLVIIALSLFACKKRDVLDEKEFELYTIKKGFQHSTTRVRVLRKDEINFIFKFDETAIYTTSNPSRQADINKLFGFSDCGAKHQENSARIGWRWYEDKLELFAYYYNNSERDQEYITTILPGKEYSCKISAKSGEYIFNVDNIIVKVPRSCTGSKSVKYYLYPFFGGSEVAPHDINIWIKER